MNRPIHQINTRLRAWQAPAVGLAIGLIYGGVTSVIDLEELKAPMFFFILDNIMTVLLPMILGLLAGIVFNYIRRQARTNRILSTQNAELQGEMLTHLLGSHILHEIRNPLHNLTAVFEEWQQRVPPEESSIVQRNILRLKVVTDQLRRWSILGATLDLRQPIPLSSWLDEFLTDKVRPQLRQAAIHLEEAIEPVIVEMHPLLLEQCFVALFNNAFAAVTDHEPRVIHLSVRLSRQNRGFVEVEIRNTGAPYPEAVLAAQAAQPLNEQIGPGLGLLLVRRTIEKVNGSLQLSNYQNGARTVISIPGYSE